MKALMVVFEKNGLFQKKEEVTAYISLNPIEGKIVIQISDPKLEARIRQEVDFSAEHIRAQGISEETTILESIKTKLLGRKLNGVIAKGAFYSTK